jgi:flap endonuclease-1
MGTAIGSLIKKELKEKIELETLKNKRLGFDAFNTIYQFITTIRSIDGTPLTNEKGEITSHLNGIFYRITNILSQGIKPVFVFDGVSHKLKDKTKQERRDRRTTAKEKYDLAIDQGDAENAHKYGKQSQTITENIIKESKELLEAFGVPCMTAPGEAEAQISVMTKNGLFDYTVSQDYDCLLFNSPNILRNINVTGKRKVVSRNIYVDSYPYVINTQKIIKDLEITHRKLIWLSILIGTDFNKKIEGVGPKTALKLVKKYNEFEDIIEYLEQKNKEITFNYKEVENIFLKPNVDMSIKYETPEINKEKIYQILVDKSNFDEERVKKHLNAFFKKKEEQEKQKTIDKWF